MFRIGISILTILCLYDFGKITLFLVNVIIKKEPLSHFKRNDYRNFPMFRVHSFRVGLKLVDLGSVEISYKFIKPN